MKAKQFKKLLARHGVTFIKSRGKGGHWIAINGDKQTTVPDHGSVDYGKEFLKDICQQLGLNPKEVL